MIGEISTQLKNRASIASNGSDVQFFYLKKEADQLALSELLSLHPECIVVNTIQQQLKDLIKLEHPALQLSEAQYSEKIAEKLNGQSEDSFGVWVYYPWRNTLVHLLDEDDFVKVRTIRNAYKITLEEQEILRRKKIGIVGLSVGQSVAMTIALERVAGEIRLADFDTLELSNMNRLRTGAQHIGLMKAEIVKREIAEIDPFIKVKLYLDGVTRDNIMDFLTSDGGLDLVVEECDSPDIKLLIRKKCQPLGIPVVMELSDRGILDIERYDVDRNYPILHDRISKELLEADELNEQQKRELLFQFMDITKISERGKRSLAEVGKTITTWPQLGSDVALGGAVVTMTSRMILLKEPIKSDRIYVDVPSIINQ